MGEGGGGVPNNVNENNKTNNLYGFRSLAFNGFLFSLAAL